MDDADSLLDRSRQGDRTALAALLERNLPRLRVFVRLHAGARLREQESCSDLVQSVCRELLQGLDRFEYRGEEQFRNWLFVAALNKIRQHDRYFQAERRGAGRREVLDEELCAVYASSLSPSGRAIAREDVARLEAAFANLPEHYRHVITLAKVVGLSQEQMAREMGRTVPAVRNLLNRALVRLAAIVEA
jgi:RNA polymerase sigma-70 factor (ECF subfamily)